VKTAILRNEANKSFIISGTCTTKPNRREIPKIEGIGTGLIESTSCGADANRLGIGPKDEFEGLLAVQMIGLHSLVIE